MALWMWRFIAVVVMPSRADYEVDLEDLARERKKFLELGFDMDRAQMLSESSVSPYKAYHLVKVKGCPLDLAFEILL